MDCDEAIKIADAAVFATTGKYLNDAQRVVLEGSWQNQTYDQIAADHDYSASYISQEVGPGLWKLLSSALHERVSKKNFRSALERWLDFNPPSDLESQLQHGNNGSIPNATSVPNAAAEQLWSIESSNLVKSAQPPSDLSHTDWGDLIADVSVFEGRIKELNQLQQWIVGNSSRLVTLWGSGGVGKTTLIFKLASEIQPQFEFLFCRSLRYTPTLLELLADLTQFFAPRTRIEFSSDPLQQIRQLLTCFQQYRCLVILDDVEAIFRHETLVGRYLEGYENYDEWFRRVGMTVHHSCLILSSREQLRSIAMLQGEKVNLYQLSGLASEDSKLLFQRQRRLEASEQDWQTLVQYYAGNPLALKIVATRICNLHNGNIAAFLELLADRSFISDDINELLSKQWKRLSRLEQEVMNWLAIAHTPLSLETLQHYILAPDAKRRLTETLESLQQRGLVQLAPPLGHAQAAPQFTLSPVMRDYVCDRFQTQVVEAIQSEAIEPLMAYALIRADTADHIRELQIRRILQPIAERLTRQYPKRRELEQKLQRMIASVRAQFHKMPGYAVGNLVNLCRHLNLPLEGYDLSNVAVWQADLADCDLLNVNFSCADASGSTFASTLGSHLVITFGQDGQQLAVGDDKGEISLWQVEEGRLLLICSEQPCAVQVLTFSPDGNILASGGEDGRIHLWDVTSGQRLSTLHERNSRHLDTAIEQIQCLSFSPDGAYLASGGSDRTVKLWHIRSGRCIRTLKGHDETVSTLAFSSDSSVLVSSSDDQTVKLWQVQTGELLRAFQGSTNFWVGAVAFGQAGQAIAATSDEHLIRLWDIETGQCFRILQGHTDAIGSLTFMPQHYLDLPRFSSRPAEPTATVEASQDTMPLLASASIDQTIKLWNLKTGECLHTLSTFDSQVCSLSFSPDGQRLASGSANSLVRLWDVTIGKGLRTLRGRRCRIYAIALSPDGATLASGNDDHTIRLWNRTGQCLKALRGHREWVRAIAWSPTGETLASGSDDRTIKLWSVSGECLATLPGHAHAITLLSFSPNGQQLASADHDGIVRLWDIPSEQCLDEWQAHRDRPSAIAFSPNGQMLATGSRDHTIHLWDTATGRCLQTLQGHTGRVHTLSFSPDQHWLASGSYDQSVRLWDLSSGNCCHTWLGQMHWVQAVAFTPNPSGTSISDRVTGVVEQSAIAHRLWASGSHDQTIEVWDLTAETRVGQLVGHTSTVWFCGFSADTRSLISASQEGEMHLWEIYTQEALRVIRGDRPYEGMNITAIKGLTPIQKANLKALGAVEW